MAPSVEEYLAAILDDVRRCGGEGMRAGSGTRGAHVRISCESEEMCGVVFEALNQASDKLREEGTQLAFEVDWEIPQFDPRVALDDASWYSKLASHPLLLLVFIQSPNMPQPSIEGPTPTSLSDAYSKNLSLFTMAESLVNALQQTSHAHLVHIQKTHLVPLLVSLSLLRSFLQLDITREVAEYSLLPREDETTSLFLSFSGGLYNRGRTVA